MYSSIDYTLREDRSSNTFLNLSCEMLGEGTFLIYIHDKDEDNCYGVTLTPKMARDLAGQLIHFSKVAEDSKTNEGE